MIDYTREKQFRIAMFERWLKLMLQRRAGERQLDCAVTFKENPPDGCDTPQLEESIALSLSPALASGEAAGTGVANGQNNLKKASISRHRRARSSDWRVTAEPRRHNLNRGERDLGRGGPLCGDG